MFTTVLKTNTGKVLTVDDIQALASELKDRANNLGFYCYPRIVKPRAKPDPLAPDDPRRIVRDIRKAAKNKPQTYKLEIGDCNDFSIEVHKLGWNARKSYNEKSGYTKTDLPNPQQREQFYNLINELFDAYNINAQVTAGYHEQIRLKKSGKVEKYDLPRDWIDTEKNIRKLVGADAREKAWKQKVNEQAKKRREMHKQWKQCDYVEVVQNKYDYATDKTIATTYKYTYTEFKDKLSSVGRGYRRRRLLESSIFVKDNIRYNSEGTQVS